MAKIQGPWIFSLAQTDVGQRMEARVEEISGLRKFHFPSVDDSKHKKPLVSTLAGLPVSKSSLLVDFFDTPSPNQGWLQAPERGNRCHPPPLADPSFWGGGAGWKKKPFRDSRNPILSRWSPFLPPARVKKPKEGVKKKREKKSSRSKFYKLPLQTENPNKTRKEKVR